MDKSKIGIGIVALFALLAPVAAATWETTMTKVGSIILDVIQYVFSPFGSATGSDFSTVVFVYLLPAILVYSILFDFVFLMGFFRRRTAQIISAIFALFGAKFGIYSNVVALIATFLGTDKAGSGVFIPMLTFLFIMMLIWWVLGHVIWGYRFTHEMQTHQSAMDYLHEIGQHLEQQTQNKKT